jgi:ABC-type branched-subunit amino acid transport system ATPase component
LIVDELSLGLAPVVVEALLRSSAGGASRRLRRPARRATPAAGPRIADRGYVLKHGRISAHADADRLRAEPSLVLD